MPVIVIIIMQNHPPTVDRGVAVSRWCTEKDEEETMCSCTFELNTRLWKRKAERERLSNGLDLLTEQFRREKEEEASLKNKLQIKMRDNLEAISLIFRTVCLFG